MPWIDKLVEAASLGKAADYNQERLDFEAGKSPEPTLDAEDLRRLILGLRDTTDPVDFHPSMCFHWDIRGLRIKGRLDIRDGRLPSGSPLPALEFVDCIFDDGIWADGAHLERLHLSRCKVGTKDPGLRLPQLSLRSVRIENELRLTRLESLDPSGLLRVDASSAHIGANLIIKRLELRAPPRWEVEDPITTPYALNLRNATVRADLLLEPELTVHGGFLAVGAHIGGDLRATGLIADDGEDPDFRQEVRDRKGRLRAAVALDSARILGNLYFITLDDRRGCSLTGEVLMPGIHIEGKLDVRGVAFDSAAVDVDCLYLWGAVIKGGFYCFDSQTRQGSKVSNSFSEGITLHRCSITGGLTVHGRYPKLAAEGLSVRGDVNLLSELGVRKNADGSGNDDEGTNAYALLNLNSSVISGSLSVTSRYSNNRWKPSTTVSEGTLYLYGATVGGELNVEGFYDCIYAKRLKVSGNCSLQVTVFNYVDFSKADLHGDLDLSRFKFFSRDPLTAKTPLGRPLFTLADADINRALKLGRPVSQDDQILFSKARFCTPLCYPQLRVVEVGASKPDQKAAPGTVFWTAFLLFPGQAVINLDGRSSPIHLVNGKGFLRLRHPRQQMDYIRFFCAYVWGDEGSFRIVEDSSDLPPLVAGQTLPQLKTMELSKDPSRKEFVLAESHVAYGNWLFRACFELCQADVSKNGKINTQGSIIMTDDSPVAEFEKKDVITFNPPLFYRDGLGNGIPSYDADWTDVTDENRLKNMIPNWRVPFRQRTVAFENALVDLSDASCGTLEDADGVAWGSDVTLQLENFTYSRITASSESSDEMISWPWNRGAAVAEKVWVLSRRVATFLRPLQQSVRQWIGFPQLPLPDFQREAREAGPRWFSNLQNSGLRRTGVQERLQWLEQRKVLQPSGVESRFEPFLQQPYTQLAKVFREQGDETEARLVEAQRIRIDRWLRAKQSISGKLALPIFGLYRIFFLYGLSPIRALSTFFFCLALGWAATAFVNDHGLLVQSTSTVATAISLNGDPTIPIVPFQPMSGKSAFDCAKAISEPLYAIDVFIPLLDLRQEGRCDIRSSSDKDVRPGAAFHAAVRTRVDVLKGVRRALAGVLLYPPLWQWLKSIYAVLGWIVTSLTILTFSGTLRKWDQGK